MKPRVFIGSSQERINIAYALGDNFNAAGTAEARVWKVLCRYRKARWIHCSMAFESMILQYLFLLGMILHRYETALWLLHETT